MRVIKKVVAIGTSAGIILNKIILDNLGIEIGDEIIIDIHKDFRRLKKDESVKKVEE